MNKVFFGLGSNMGEKSYLIGQAIALIESNMGQLIKTSSMYESEPWGFLTSEWFLNAVVMVETDLNPQEILVNIAKIEQQLGRVRHDSGYESRRIDIDILFYNDLVISNNDLTIPHPRLHERKFVLIPLEEIAAEFVHPVFNQSIYELLQNCKDISQVRLIKP